MLAAWQLTSVACFLKLSRPLLLELIPSFPVAEMRDIFLDTGLTDNTLWPPGEKNVKILILKGALYYVVLLNTLSF